MFSYMRNKIAAHTGRPSRGDVVYLRKDGKDLAAEFEEGSIENGTATVWDLRNQAAKLSGVDAGRLILAFSGAQLSNDGATLSSAGIKPGSKVLVTASVPTPLNRNIQAEDTAETEGTTGDEQTKKTKKTKKKKKGSKKKGAKKEEELETVIPIEQIAPKKLTGVDLMENIREKNKTIIYPLVEAYLTNPPSGAVKLEEEHRRLTETLLAEMLKLDSVESTDGDVRLKRKALVKEMQAKMNALDEKWKEEKAKL